ncbi:MAG: epimerase [Deltaproteobacteria bacterium HGW-Deltaproteobacteria-15]|jgi:UDP-glucose 4-epimerase|nr:MAG: epimerase [Deltaproteobacteria bacterium HGW-Deltaproteobacteria-15]
MNLLITGGCGFIGLNLIDYLRRESKHRIVVLDNLIVGKREYLNEFDVCFFEGDIRDANMVKEILRDENIEGIIHLAADTRVVDSIENPDFNFDVNVNGTYSLLRVARSEKVERFVFASTGGAIIGETTPPVHEEMVPRPISPYGASKLCGEAYCSALAGSYGMKTVALRFSNVYGPRSFHKGSVVAQFFKKIVAREDLVVYGNGEQTRDFVYVEDLCSAISASLHLEEGGKVFQLGTGIETSINTLVERIKECVGGNYKVRVLSMPPRQGEILKNFCSISRARKDLGYFPKVDLKEGLERTWKWFKG